MKPSNIDATKYPRMRALKTVPTTKKKKIVTRTSTRGTISIVVVMRASNIVAVMKASNHAPAAIKKKNKCCYKKYSFT